MSSGLYHQASSAVKESRSQGRTGHPKFRCHSTISQEPMSGHGAQAPTNCPQLLPPAYSLRRAVWDRTGAPRSSKCPEFVFCKLHGWGWKAMNTDVPAPSPLSSPILAKSSLTRPAFAGQTPVVSSSKSPRASRRDLESSGGHFQKQEVGHHGCKCEYSEVHVLLTSLHLLILKTRTCV